MRLCTTTGGFRSSMFGFPRVASVCGVHPILYRSYAVPKDQVTQRVINIVKAFDKVNGDLVKPESHFIKDLGLDSLDVVELGLALEEEFAIEIPDADADAILSVPDAVNYLSAHPQTR